MTVAFSLELHSGYVTDTNSLLFINYTADIKTHVFFIRCSNYLQSKLKIPDLAQVDWTLRRETVNKLPMNLRLWLSKSLLNFSGTAHKFH